jgi:hypothetical protein
MDALLLLLLLGSHHNKTPTQTVDRIEINTCEDDAGNECYTQAIIWRWSHDYLRYDAACWTMSFNATPYRDGWLVRAGKIVVYTEDLRRSFTPTRLDPERVNQRWFGSQFRGLIMPRE